MDADFNFQDDTIDLRRYVAVLWRWKWLIVACTLLAAGAAFIASRLQTPVYQASTTLLIDQAPDSQTSDYTAILTAERLARTYAQMLTQRPVLEETLSRLGDGEDVDALKEAVEVQMVRDTQLIKVTVEHTDPQRAAELANTLVEVFAEQNQKLQAARFEASKQNLSAQLERLDEQIAETEAAIAELESPKTTAERAELERLKGELAKYQESYTTLLKSYEQIRLEEARALSNVVQVEPATLPEEPIRPRALMNTALAAVVGAMLAVGAVFIIEYLDETVKTTEEASRTLGLPIIGFLAHSEKHAQSEPLTALEPRSPLAEAYRVLRTNIQFAGVDTPIKTLLITSPGPKEGKSTVAANLAVVMAQSGKRVLLVEADLRRPRLHKLLSLPDRPGLTDIFVRPKDELPRIITPWKDTRLAVVPSGKLPPNPAELLGSQRMAHFISAMAAKYDLVILDSPPVGVVTDPTVLSARVDGVILVVEPGKSRMPAAVTAVEQLRRAGANLIGLVFNNVAIGRAGYYTGYYNGYYYYYKDGYAYGEDGKGEGRWARRARKRRQKKGAS